MPREEEELERETPKREPTLEEQITGALAPYTLDVGLETQVLETLKKYQEEPTTAGMAWEALKATPGQTIGVIMDSIQGYKGVAVGEEMDFADRWVTNQEQRRAELDLKYNLDSDVLFGTMKARELAEFPHTLGYTLGTLITGAPGAAVGGLATGSPLGAYAAGMGLSGAAMYRSSKAQIGRAYLQEMDAQKFAEEGRHLTKQEQDKLKTFFEDRAHKYGLWEAIPEAVGSWAGAFLLTRPLNAILGGELAGRVIARAFGKLGAESWGPPVGRGIAALGEKVAMFGGEELASEAITEIGQSQALAGSVLARGEEPLEWTGEDLMTAMKRVAPQIGLLAVTLGGFGAASTAAYNRFMRHPQNRDMIKDAAAEGQLDKLPDAKFAEISSIVDKVAAAYPRDRELQAAREEFHMEGRRRVKEALLQGVKEQVQRGTVTAIDLENIMANKALQRVGITPRDIEKAYVEALAEEQELEAAEIIPEEEEVEEGPPEIQILTPLEELDEKYREVGDEKVRAFIQDEVRKLGSLERVDARYRTKDNTSAYAKEFARLINLPATAEEADARAERPLDEMLDEALKEAEALVEPEPTIVTPVAEEPVTPIEEEGVTTTAEGEYTPPVSPPVEEVVTEGAKELWQMTMQEAFDAEREGQYDPEAHREAVTDAYLKGKDVPKAVLVDFGLTKPVKPEAEPTIEIEPTVEEKAEKPVTEAVAEMEDAEIDALVDATPVETAKAPEEAPAEEPTVKTHAKEGERLPQPINYENRAHILAETYSTMFRAHPDVNEELGDVIAADLSSEARVGAVGSLSDRALELASEHGLGEEIERQIEARYAEAEAQTPAIEMYPLAKAKTSDLIAERDQEPTVEAHEEDDADWYWSITPDEPWLPEGGLVERREGTYIAGETRTEATAPYTTRGGKEVPAQVQQVQDFTNLRTGEKQTLTGEEVWRELRVGEAVTPEGEQLGLPIGARPAPTKTATDIIKEAAAEGVKGIDETLKGLHRLFGGEGLKTFPGAIDENTYQEAKPHFEKALEHFTEAGKSLKELVQFLVNQHGEIIKPYLKRWLRELKGITAEPEVEEPVTPPTPPPPTPKPEEAVEEPAEEPEGEIVIEGEGVVEEAEEVPEEDRDRIKLEDWGEELGGKRGSPDPTERVTAIEVDLQKHIEGASPEVVFKSIKKITQKAKLWKIADTTELEGRTYGAVRYLRELRMAFYGFIEFAGEEFGGVRSPRYGEESFTQAIISSLENDDEEGSEQRKLRELAARYIAAIELTAAAVEEAATVADVRTELIQAYIVEDTETLILDPIEIKRKWSYYKFLKAPRDAEAESPFTDLAHRVHGISKYGRLRDLLADRGLKYEEGENEPDRNQQIVRRRVPLMEIETDGRHRQDEDGNWIYDHADMRPGDVIGEDLGTMFGLRGVDYGKWVNTNERAQATNLTFDAMADIAEIIGAPPLGISVNKDKRLGVGWGARGSGGPTAAFFDLARWLIALTKTKGDGSFAHEWGHAFDFMAGQQYLVPSMAENEDESFRHINPIADLKEAFRVRYEVEGLREKVERILRGLWMNDSLRNDPLQDAKDFLETDWERQLKEDTFFYMMAKAMDQLAGKSYYAKPEEMFSRAFESWISDELLAGGHNNFYLVDHEFVAPGFIENFFNWQNGLYPQERERERFALLFRRFFDGIEWDAEGIPSMKKDYVPVTEQERRDVEAAIQELRDKLEEIYDFLYRGEAAADGFWWYAYKVTGRAPMMQPKGYVGHDDAYRYEVTDEEGEVTKFEGVGAIAYDRSLMAVDVVKYQLEPIAYEPHDKTVYVGEDEYEGAGQDWVTPEEDTGVGEPGIGGEPETEADVEELPEEPTGEGEPAGPPPDTGSGRDPRRGDRASDSRIDYTLASTSIPDGRSSAERFNDNVAAIRLLKLIEDEGRLATAEEQHVLVRYSGWSGIDQPLDDWWAPDAWKERARLLKRLLTSEERSSAKQNTVDAYYTPTYLIELMYESLFKMGIAGGRILEPALGIGHFFGVMPPELRAEAISTGVELDNLSARIAQQLYQTHRVIPGAYQDADLPANFYDLIFSNVPFGDSVPFDAKHNLQEFVIHDYFFNKSLDLLKPGGILAFITSTGTLDKAGREAREAMALKAEFLGAVRLPNGVFEGVQAGADVVFMRKQGEGLPKVPSHNFIETELYDGFALDSSDERREGTQPVRINEYFLKNPDMVVGEIGSDWRGRTAVIHNMATLEEDIRKAMEKLPVDVYAKETGPEVKDLEDTIPAPGYIREGAHYVGEDGNIYINEGGNPIAVSKTRPKGWKSRMKGMIGLRELVRDVLRAEAQRDPNREKIRAKLKKAYTAFVKKWGPVNDKPNIDTFWADPDAASVFGLEKYSLEDQKVTGLSDIFKQDVLAPVSPPEIVESSSEAFLQSLNWRGKVDLKWMAQVTGLSQDQLKKELVGRIYNDPVRGWVSADEYLSGNVRKKLAQAENAAKQDPVYEANVEALKRVIPKDLTKAGISVQMGAPWIPARYIKRFINHIMVGARNFYIDYVPEPGHLSWGDKIGRARSAGDKGIKSWQINWGGRYDSQNRRGEIRRENRGLHAATVDWGTRFNNANFWDLLDMALNGGLPSIDRPPHEVLKEVYQELISIYYEEDVIEGFVGDMHYYRTMQEVRDGMISWLENKDPSLVESLRPQIQELYERTTDRATKYDADGNVSIVNIFSKASTDHAISKLQAIKASFEQWIWDSTEREEKLTKRYNEHINSYKSREFDGTHLTLPGKVPDVIWKYRKHQLDAVWRFLQMGSAYLAHEVGTGKTFVYVAAIMEARRLGLAKKPIFIVQKATLEQIMADFNRTYPTASILQVKIPQADMVEKMRVLRKIQMEDWDCILLHHESFKEIRMSQSTVREFIQEEVNAVRAAWRELGRQGAHVQTLRALEQRIKRMEERLRAHTSTFVEQEEGMLTFEDLGIDMVVADEAHAFKNLRFETSYGSQVKGLGQQSKTGRSFDMFMKTSYLHRGEGRVLFGSGTPLTNTVGELYSLSRYLHPQELRRLRLHNFDAWAHTWGRVDTEPEWKPQGGGFKDIMRFGEWVNIYDLITIVRENIDFQRTEDLGLERPELEGGKPQAVLVKPSPFVDAYSVILQHRADMYARFPMTASWFGRRDPIVRIINDARNMSIDPRMVFAGLPEPARFEDGSPATKLQAAEDIIMERYTKHLPATRKDTGTREEYKEKNHAILVFLDRGVPGGSIPFNAYQELKNKLVERGIPASKIKFIHQAKKPELKEALIKDVRAGKIRVLIGSTELMGIGLNIQKRVSTLIHIDVDWNYAKYEQRNGRGWRFGNNLNKLLVSNIGTEGTVDTFMWGKVAYKGSILGEIYNLEPGTRVIRGDLAQDIPHAHEMQAALSGDPLTQKQVMLDAQVSRLRSQRGAFVRQKEDDRRRLDELPELREGLEARKEHLSGYKKQIDQVNAVTVGLPMTKKTESAEYMEFDFTKKGPEANKQAEALLTGTEFKAMQSSPKSQIPIGRFGKITYREEEQRTKLGRKKIVKVPEFTPIGNMYLSWRWDFMNNEAAYVLSAGSAIKRTFTKKGGISRIISTTSASLDKQLGEIAEQEQKYNELEPKLKTSLEKEWDGQEELSGKESELDSVNAELRAKMQEMEEEKARGDTGLMTWEEAILFIARQMRAHEHPSELRALLENMRRAGVEADWEWLFPVEPKQYRTGPTIDTGMRAQLRKIVDYFINVRERPLGPAVDLKAVRKFFKGRKVRILEDGRQWVIELAPGRHLAINRVEELSADKVVVEVSYGPGTATNDRVAVLGKTENGTIALHKLADTWVLAHESYHVLEQMGLIRPGEVAALKATIKRLVKQGKWEAVNPNDVGGPEDRAHYVADQLTREKPRTITKRIIEKIKDFIADLANYFMATSRGAIREMETGRMWEREAGEILSHGPEYSMIELLPEHVRERWREAKITRPELRERFKETVQKTVTTFTPGREFHLLSNKYFGRAIEILRNWKQARIYGKWAAVKNVLDILRPENLSREQLELFTMKLVLDDMVADMEEGRPLAKWEEMVEVYGEIAFGFQHRDEIEESLTAINNAIQDDPKVLRALERRKEKLLDLQKHLVAANLLPEAVAGDPNYFHHQVLEYANIRYGIGTGHPDFRERRHGYQIHRVPNIRDFNNEYVESEYEWMAQAITQLEQRKNIEEMEEHYNIIKSLRQKATARNVSLIERMYAQMWEEGNVAGWNPLEPSSHPLFKFRRNIAIAMTALGQLAADGELWGPAQFEPVIEQLRDSHEQRKADVADYPEDPDMWTRVGADFEPLMQFLKYMIDNELPGAREAATMFKAIQGRNRLMKQKLGLRHATWQTMMKEEPPMEGSEGWIDWTPKPGGAWYMVNSITDKMAELLLSEAHQLTEADIKKVYARGHDTRWVIPVELAKTLDRVSLSDMPSDNVVGRVAERSLNAWKQWILLNPYRIIKYNLNNLSGDFDIVLAYDPKIIKYTKQAAIDLWKHHYKKPMGPVQLREFDRAMRDGVIDSGMTYMDIPDVGRAKEVEDLHKALDGQAPHIIKRFWKQSKNFTTWRENVLRLAAYRYFKERIGAGDRGMFGASDRAKVMATADPLRRAALLARELVGDYGAISEGGQWLRRKVIPFYSWMEINAPRYYRLMQNLPHEGRGRGQAAGVLSAAFARKAAGLAIKMSLLFAMVNLYNNLFFPDEEEELGEVGRRQLHLILPPGRRADGSIITLRFQGALSDALAWIGLEDFPQDIEDLAKRRKTVWQFMAEAPEEFVNKLIQGARPDIKIPFEMLTSRSLYPDWTEPRPIRDRLEHVTRLFSLDPIYRFALGRPRRGGSVLGRLTQDLMNLGTYHADPGEIAYHTIRKWVNEYLERNNAEKPKVEPTSRSNALYYYKTSLKYGDANAAIKYLQDYRDLGGNLKGMRISVKKAHPVAHLPIKYRKKFKAGLDPEERQTYNVALKWYRETYRGKGREE
jgi:N12 class adenine-specific DNA methylase/superfamily II DNA/RNA helicase